jgi:4-deoxy-L-threo-5-hexosulose-uronate ketol-isomerase
MKTIRMADPVRYPRMTSAEIRDAFLLTSLDEPGRIHLCYVDLDRAVIGMAAPLDKPLTLDACPELRAKYFTERRELGVLNIGGNGAVLVNSNRFELENLDVLYIGRGNEKISFTSSNPAQPAVFYLLSYPSHATDPVTLVRKQEAQSAELGSIETCNRRRISRYIHLEGARSSQLVMGVTHLEPGSSWNTMPAHTHDRRSEVYMYFNLPQNARVFHLMGPADETRHIVMNNREVVVSPGWSIHSGVGTSAYSFCWGMGGENQDYSDMDPVPIETLR